MCDRPRVHTADQVVDFGRRLRPIDARQFLGEHRRVSRQRAVLRDARRASFADQAHRFRQCLRPKPRKPPIQFAGGFIRSERRFPLQDHIACVKPLGHIHRRDSRRPVAV